MCLITRCKQGKTNILLTVLKLSSICVLPKMAWCRCAFSLSHAVYFVKDMGSEIVTL